MGRVPWEERHNAMSVLAVLLLPGQEFSFPTQHLRVSVRKHISSKEDEDYLKPVGRNFKTKPFRNGIEPMSLCAGSNALQAKVPLGILNTEEHH